MNDRVSVVIRDGVADVRLTRPEKMNALDDAMFDALVAAGDRLAADASLRCVVLSGEGRAFCGGLDMGSFGRIGGGDTDVPGAGKPLAVRTRGAANREQYAVLVWRQLPVPVIAAVHGVAFGGGLQLMLGADLRFVTPDARLSVMEIKWGLVPDMAGTVLMRGLLADDIMRDLIYTGREFSGVQALEYGLATRVCDDPLDEAQRVAEEIARKSPSAIRAAKRLCNDLNKHDVAAALLAESAEQDVLLAHPHHAEAVGANFQQRKPVFED
jgi:enoyl-CoA hydratase/carnithine racemase